MNRNSKIADGFEIDDSSFHNFYKNKINNSSSNISSETQNALINKTYLNGLPFELDRTAFVSSIIEWLSNVAAADLISTKNIDVFVSDMEGKLDRAKSYEFDNLLKKNYLEIKIYDLAKRASLTGIAGIWFMPRIIDEIDNKYSLNSDLQVVQYKVVNNEPQAVSFLVNLVEGIAIGNVYAFIYVDKFKYKTTFHALNKEDLEEIKRTGKDFDWNDEEARKRKEYSLDELQEYLSSFKYNSDLIAMMNQEHNLGFLPFFTLFFNQTYEPLIDTNLLNQDLNELFAIAQKLYDEANMMGTKVKWVNDGDINSSTSHDDLANMIKILGSLAGIYAKGDFNSDQNNNADVDLITKPPVYVELFNSFKTKLNFILKKIGLSSDTDSKGTVQQSIGEIIRQNEFSYNNQNYRNMILQNYLQNLLTSFFKANFTNAEIYKVKILSTQSLGMSEMEKLNYVVMAKTNGLIDVARGISILTGKNYIDSLAIMELQDLKVSNKQPNLFKNNNTGEQ